MQHIDEFSCKDHEPTPGWVVLLRPTEGETDLPFIPVLLLPPLAVFSTHARRNCVLIISLISFSTRRAFGISFHTRIDITTRPTIPPPPSPLLRSITFRALMRKILPRRAFGPSSVSICRHDRRSTRKVRDLIHLTDTVAARCH